MKEMRTLMTEKLGRIDATNYRYHCSKNIRKNVEEVDNDLNVGQNFSYTHYFDIDLKIDIEEKLATH